MKCRAGVNGGQRQQQGQQTVTHVMRVMATAAQNPAESDKNGRQRQRDPNARQNIFADTRAGQAVGQRIENRVIDPVAGEIVTGIKRDIQDNKNPQHR